MRRFRARFVFAAAFLMIGAAALVLNSCGGGGGGGSTTSTTPTPTVGSSGSGSGAVGVYTNNGATYALTPGSAGASGTANLLSLPNTGNLVGAITVTQVTKTPIATSLTYLGSPAAISGTSVDPANDIGMAFNYYIGKISLFKLSTATEITTYDTSTTNTLSFSGAGIVMIAGAVMNPANKTIILATADGFEVVSYASPASPAKVREIPSLPVSATNGVEIMENFAFDSALPNGGTNYAMIITGGGSAYYGGVTGTAGPAMVLVDSATGTVYRPDMATAALFVTSSYIDSAAVDTNYHVAILADEGTGTTFVDLNKLTLDSTAGTYSLPSTAVKRITAYSEMDNLGIESTNHLVMMGEGYGGISLVAGLLENPATALGFSKEVVVNMPTGTDDAGAPVSWSGSRDPHGAGAYITPSDHPTEPNRSLGLWLSYPPTHIAVIDLQGVLDGTLAGGTYDPTTTSPKDIAYFAIP
ncbi:MAG: hypothetical protein HY204_02745 [Nitrospirae bacterium]|nr:hypothetical protein [Nitrospirota bacterium]